MTAMKNLFIFWQYFSKKNCAGGKQAGTKIRAHSYGHMVPDLGSNLFATENNTDISVSWLKFEIISLKYGFVIVYIWIGIDVLSQFHTEHWQKHVPVHLTVKPALTLSPHNKLLSTKFLIRFNFQSASMLLKVGENVVWVSNNLNLGETSSYSASHPNQVCLHIWHYCYE